MKTAMAAAALAALSVSGAARADDVSGSWKITGDVFGNAVETVCAFQGTDKVTAACEKDGKPGPATPATVAGKDVTWSWDAGEAVLTFKGALESDKAMKGAIEVSGVTGTFTAVKQ